MPLTAREVRHLNALTALDEGRLVDEDELRLLAEAGMAGTGLKPALTLEGRLQLRNLLSQVRGEIERGMSGLDDD
jgi:hypothetical protein